MSHLPETTTIQRTGEGKIERKVKLVKRVMRLSWEEAVKSWQEQMNRALYFCTVIKPVSV
jgi:hypothetical protein